jgi:hypothetical protein
MEDILNGADTKIHNRIDVIKLTGETTEVDRYRIEDLGHVQQEVVGRILEYFRDGHDPKEISRFLLSKGI